VEIAMHLIRKAVAPICLSMALLGCGSGSDVVAIPGADAVVTAPVASIDRPPATETVPPTTDSAGAVTTTAAPVATEAPAPSTTSPAPDTTAAPPVTEAPVEDIYLRVGDEGLAVASMQLRLSVLDYLRDGSDTGIFDEATDRALRSFQADYGLGVDGVFGPITDRALNAAAQSVEVEG
jgi:peptidoglycan hydrolase-like protein with peptidoglycan-binding domain